MIKYSDLTAGMGVGDGEGEDAVEEVTEAGLEEDWEGEADTVTGDSSSRRFFSLGIFETLFFQFQVSVLFSTMFNVLIV